MSTKEGNADHWEQLRRRAEEALLGRPIDLNGISQEDFQYLLHELQVHQVELTMQNDELRRVQLELETSRDQYSDLYNFAPIGYCTLNRQYRILEANKVLADMLSVEQKELIHTPFTRFVGRDSQDAFYLLCRRTLLEQDRQRGEIRLITSTQESVEVQLESVIARGDPSKIRIVISDITERKRAEAALREAQETEIRIQHLLIDEREQERQQIAHDLHDGPLQVLVATAFNVQEMILECNDPAMSARLEELRQSIKNQIVELRSYSRNLHPATLTSYGLEHAIQSNLDVVQKKYPNINIQFETDTINFVISETARLALFRIYREALNNILIHALSTTTEILLRLEKDDHQVQMVIRDNGIGFDLPDDWFGLAREGHLGLIGMRERAEAIGGQLEIHSRIGYGTQVVVTVPVDELPA